jgi:hypothetical protein
VIALDCTRVHLIALDCTLWLTTSHAPLSPQVRGLSRQSGLLLLSPQWILFEPEAEELPNKEEELAPSGFTSWARDGEPDASEVGLIATDCLPNEPDASEVRLIATDCH